MVMGSGLPKGIRHSPRTSSRNQGELAQQPYNWQSISNGTRTWKNRIYRFIGKDRI